MLTIAPAIRALIPAAIAIGQDAATDLDEARWRLESLLAEWGIPRHLPDGTENPAAVALEEAVDVGLRLAHDNCQN